MDSDSDQFESADEEFDSDEERHNSSTLQTKYARRLVELKETKVKNITVAENNENRSVPRSESQEKLEKNNIKANETANEIEKIADITPTQTTIQSPTCKSNRISTLEKKERPQRSKEPKTKIGVRLGVKIDKSKFQDATAEKNVLKSEDETENSEYCQISETPAEHKNQPLDLKSTCKESEKDENEDCGWEDDVNWATIENEENLYSQKPTSEKTYWEKEADYMELPQKRENIPNPLDKIADDKQQTSSSWVGWGNWGVSSLISSATLGVSTLTSSVSQGITTVLETGIGAPDPEELARIDQTETFRCKKQENKSDEQLRSSRNSSFGLGNLVSGVSHITKLVETTGTKVISGGLDTLEVIGKKTMEVLQEGDPGFKKKKAFLGIDHEKPVLSHILREAKEKGEEENRFLEEHHIAKKAHYETLFDDHQGLVHLEALEMLSKQCDIKLETIIESYMGNELVEMQETMTQIKELCELPDEDEENEMLDVDTIKERLDSAVADLNVKITYEHLFQTWTNVDEWLCDDTQQHSEHNIHEKAIETLARLTAIAVEQFHKSGELLLVKERRSTVDEADSLVQLTTTLRTLIGIIAGKFSEKLNALASSHSDVNSLITNIFLEAANSSSYIQDAFQLLIPVLQVGAV